MDSLIETFHIDIKLLLAQVVNFAIVFSALYFFALKPLLKIMGERTETIEKSLNEAKMIEKKLASTEEDYNLKLAQAKKEANIILEKASKQAEEKKQETITKAKEEIGLIINKEKEKMRMEKAETLKEIKKETVDLVMLALEKILDEKIDKKKSEELIKKSLK